MEPKDQMKKELKGKRTRPFGKTGQKQTVGEADYLSDSHYPADPEPGDRRGRVSRKYNRKSEEDSKGNFLSSFNNILGLAGVVAGGAVLYRAAKGDWPFSKKTGEDIQLHTRQTIKRSREELYAYWRNLENLPNFMSHIKEIKEIDERRSRWTAEIPGGLGTVEWEAVIEQDIQNEYISWRSIADADIENYGEVRFINAGGSNGTIVETTISYSPPAGQVGKYAAKLLNPAFEKIVNSDLKQFKKHMEKGGEERRRTQPTDDLLY